jgi:hypothetical protein
LFVKTSDFIVTLLISSEMLDEKMEEGKRISRIMHLNEMAFSRYKCQLKSETLAVR